MGCKSDAETNRVVSQDEARAFAMEFSMIYSEISVKQDHGVDGLLNSVVRSVS